MYTMYVVNICRKRVDLEIEDTLRYLDLTLDGGLYYILHNGGRLVPAYKPEKHTAKF